ncbi:NDR1/HIN1-like protein 13 [Papaver somniferum]|uniref:NDR1/HIN1-like protein 13 n=1 Tax=Papaver somniferum TaxID=3469 RepID=UPI000E705ADF|nr:NDR1/HIN1-like protein 13 [Papaver somniferum]
MEERVPSFPDLQKQEEEEHQQQPQQGRQPQVSPFSPSPSPSPQQQRHHQISSPSPTPSPSPSPQQLLPPPPGQAAFPITTGSGRTYIVQVPKTQIYRVPPPENALIIERHLKPENQENPRCSFLFWFFIIIGVILVVLGATVAVIYFTVRPQEPIYLVDKVVVQNQDSSPHRPQYHITLRSRNPNERMGISYQDGGSATLSYKQSQIAKGNPPSLYQDNKETKNIRIDLKSLHIVLPHEVLKSMKETTPKANARIALMLRVNVPMTMKIAFIRSWDLNMEITCNFRPKYWLSAKLVRISN